MYACFCRLHRSILSNFLQCSLVDQNTELKENLKKDAKAVFILQTRVSITIFPKIVECTKSHNSLETLEKACKGSIKVKVVKIKILKSDFESLTMNENESVEYFIRRVKSIVNVIHAHGKFLE